MKFTSVVILLILLFPAIGESYKKPAAPPELTQIMGLLESVEIHFKERNWPTAQSELTKVNSLVKKILPNLQKNTSYIILTTFRESVARLKLNLLAKEYTQVEDEYILLSMAYFVITDTYDLGNPPLFLVNIGNSINESKEAIEKEHFKNISYEMDEVGKFVEHYGAILQLHGIDLKTIEKFIRIADNINKATTKQDLGEIEDKMNKLESTYAHFVETYKAESLTAKNTTIQPSLTAH